MQTILDFITGNNIATEAEIELITSINGYSEDTLNDIIYARTGYRSMHQAAESEPGHYVIPFSYAGEYREI